MNDHDEIREAMTREAESWLRTKFHHEARVKGAGVDCGMLLLEVYEKAGLIPHIDVPHYPIDFMLHRNEEWYLLLVLKYCYEVGPPGFPGDIVLFKNGRSFSHGAIVMNWPILIHASADDRCVCWASIDQAPLAGKKYRIFRHNRFREA